MHETITNRANPMIDPALHIWGWEIPVYLFLGGLAAGLMILSAMLARRDGAPLSRWARRLPFAAPALLSLGMLALFLDLEHPAHVFRFYLAFRPASPMSWGAWILVAIYPASLLYGLALLTDEEWAPAARAAGPFEKFRAFAVAKTGALAWINAVLGIALGAYTGVLLGNLGARAAWNSPVLAPLFLVSGFSTGAALAMLLPLSPSEKHLLRRWDLAAIGVEAALLGLFLVGLSTGGAATREAAALFLGGAFTAPFFVFVVIAGLGVPFVLEAVEWRKKLAPTLFAPALLLAGGLALRWVLVAAGQA
ncbi:MAG: polysulfide reductase NrfD [Deltaproteobacteria bacterium]|nr:polysulfide reductase NrfD [Deltaproteobacteria bacterium]